MGLTELLMILASVIASAAILGVLHRLARTGRIPFLPARWNPLAVAVALSLCSALTLIGLVTVPSPSAGAGRPVDEADTEEQSGAKVYVYAMENYGTRLRRDAVGSSMARRICEILIDRGIPARKGVEHHIPLDIVHMERPSEHLMAHYRKVAPFTCAWGSVAIKRDGSLEIQMTLTSVERSLRTTELLVRTISCSDSPSSIEQATTELAEAIADAIEERGE